MFLKYYTIADEDGTYRYLSKIIISDEDYVDFLCWLEKCEKADLIFFFTITEDCKGYKSMYGFSNFEIKEFKHTEISYFSFPNNSAFKKYFSCLEKESKYCIVPSNLHGYVEAIAKAALMQELSEQQ